MLTVVKSIILQGLLGVVVKVEVDSSPGIPSWEIIGLPGTSIREAKERVKTALKNTGIELKSKKYIINLLPANIRKDGVAFDLAIAIGVLANLNIIKSIKMDEMLFIGELSLTGKINKIQGVLPLCVEAKKNSIKKVFLPIENVREGNIVEGIEVYGVKTLKEIISILNEQILPNKCTTNFLKIKNENNYKVDFKDVKGQKYAKRALEVTAAGGHNCLLIGNPGCGKTMMAERLITILPDLTFDEALDITKIQSISGELKEELIMQRPFRMPHYSITKASLLGGGKNPRPGEITLANYGVLFLDELPQFSKNILDLLRGPLEDRKIVLSRAMITVCYPTNFILIASMNPCPCGYLGSKNRKCICTDKQIQQYRNKISGPLLDRIDLHIEVPPVNFENIKNTEVETSAEIKTRVDKARKIQIVRYKRENIHSNAELDNKMIEKYCKLDDESEEVLKKAFERMNLTARAYIRILKVARTIADLDASEKIKKNHLIEAIGYRNLDKNENNRNIK